MDNRLSYQRAEGKKGRNPVVNQYLYYLDGSLKEASGGGITCRYEYTENGLLKSKASSGKILLAYGYDKNRSLSSLTDVTGKTVRYVYDAVDRLKRVEDGTQGTALAGYEYTDSGRLRALEYGNGVRSEYRYGDDGMPSGLVTVTPTGEVVLNYDYAYDGNGNCTKKSGERFQNEYTYDRMNRLAGAVYNGEWEKYTYDRAGNRLGGIRSGAGVRKNRYDGESLRYETEENDKVTRFVFDRGELASEESGAGGIRYIHGDDRMLCSERENTGMGYHIRDEAGSTLFILDRERNIRKSYRYDAFGRVLEERGDIENRLTYTGQMYDGGTGQYYLRARFYNPVTGRFLQEDVYRGDGLNLYAYCANNPVKYYDPSGYMSLCPGGKTFPGNGDGGRKADFYVTPSGDVVPSMGYRYMDSKYAEQTIDSMNAPGSYFGFKKYNSASAAQDGFQIAPEWSDCKLRGEFDTLQVIDEMYVPKAYGDKGPGLEPFTHCYPEYGKGGQQQFIYKGTIKFDNVDIIGD